MVIAIVNNNRPDVNIEFVHALEVSSLREEDGAQIISGLDASYDPFTLMAEPGQMIQVFA